MDYLFKTSEDKLIEKSVDMGQCLEPNLAAFLIKFCVLRENRWISTGMCDILSGLTFRRLPFAAAPGWCPTVP